MTRRIAILWLGVATLAAAASGQSGIFELDAQQSRVTFTLPATMHTVHGSFVAKGGRIQFDRASGNASGEVLLDATSARTGNEGRDRKMHRDILESEKFPQIVFAARRLTGEVPNEGRGQVTLEGTITLHGASHPVSLAFPVEIRAGQLTGDASLVVPYVEWGLKNPSTFLLHVSEKVTVEIHVVGRVGR